MAHSHVKVIRVHSSQQSSTLEFITELLREQAAAWAIGSCRRLYGSLCCCFGGSGQRSSTNLSQQAICKQGSASKVPAPAGKQGSASQQACSGTHVTCGTSQAVMFCATSASAFSSSHPPAGMHRYTPHAPSERTLSGNTSGKRDLNPAHPPKKHCPAHPPKNHYGPV